MGAYTLTNSTNTRRSLSGGQPMSEKSKAAADLERDKFEFEKLKHANASPAQRQADPAPSSKPDFMGSGLTQHEYFNNAYKKNKKSILNGHRAGSTKSLKEYRNPNNTFIDKAGAGLGGSGNGNYAKDAPYKVDESQFTKDKQDSQLRPENDPNAIVNPRTTGQEHTIPSIAPQEQGQKPWQVDESQFSKDKQDSNLPWQVDTNSFASAGMMNNLTNLHTNEEFLNTDTGGFNQYGEKSDNGGFNQYGEKSNNTGNKSGTATPWQQLGHSMDTSGNTFYGGDSVPIRANSKGVIGLMGNIGPEEARGANARQNSQERFDNRWDGRNQGIQLRNGALAVSKGLGLDDVLNPGSPGRPAQLPTKSLPGGDNMLHKNYGKTGSLGSPAVPAVTAGTPYTPLTDYARQQRISENKNELNDWKHSDQSTKDFRQMEMDADRKGSNISFKESSIDPVKLRNESARLGNSQMNNRMARMKYGKAMDLFNRGLGPRPNPIQDTSTYEIAGEIGNTRRRNQQKAESNRFGKLPIRNATRDQDYERMLQINNRVSGLGN